LRVFNENPTSKFMFTTPKEFLVALLTALKDHIVIISDNFNDIPSVGMKVITSIVEGLKHLLSSMPYLANEIGRDLEVTGPLVVLLRGEFWGRSEFMSTLLLVLKPMTDFNVGLFVGLPTFERIATMLKEESLFGLQGLCLDIMNALLSHPSIIATVPSLEISFLEYLVDILVKETDEIIKYKISDILWKFEDNENVRDWANQQISARESTLSQILPPKRALPEIVNNGSSGSGSESDSSSSSSSTKWVSHHRSPSSTISNNSNPKFAIPRKNSADDNTKLPS